VETELRLKVLNSKVRMKNYNLIPQEKDNYCVCSVLQAILDFHYPKVNLIDLSDGKIRLKDYEEMLKKCMKQKVFLD
jgi:hypothetical protein